MRGRDTRRCVRSFFSHWLIFLLMVREVYLAWARSRMCYSVCARVSVCVSMCALMCMCGCFIMYGCLWESTNAIKYVCIDTRVFTTLFLFSLSLEPNQELFVDQQAGTVLVSALSLTQAGAKSAAARALSNVSLYHDFVRSHLGAAGVVPALLPLLKSNEYVLQLTFLFSLWESVYPLTRF